MQTVYVMVRVAVQAADEDDAIDIVNAQLLQAQQAGLLIDTEITGAEQ